MADNRFLGTGMKFPPQIDPATGKFVTVSGNQVVKEAIYLILMTQMTERFVRPNFGSNIMSYAFMDTGTTMMSILRTSISQTILEQEPRISDLDIETEYRANQGAIIINLNYMVSATNTRDNLVFPFYLDRAEDESGDMSMEENGDYYDGEQESYMMEDDSF
ncbi:MAG: GPW/gp25 family protein [Lachnospiraceae bacterium]|nr:GPW/gp25 family protein [Lachnospiraceae bacterium]